MQMLHLIHFTRLHILKCHCSGDSTFITTFRSIEHYLNSHSSKDSGQKSNKNDTIMIRRSRLCAFILEIITLVLILFMGQSHRVFQYSPSGLPNSLIYKTNKSKIDGGKSMTSYGDMDLYLRMTSAVPILINFYENVLIQSMRYFWPDVSSMVLVWTKKGQWTMRLVTL